MLPASVRLSFSALMLTLASCGSSSSSGSSSVPENVAAETDTVAIGQPAPGFELPDETGETQSLEDLNAGRYLVLVFNRGHW